MYHIKCICHICLYFYAFNKKQAIFAVYPITFIAISLYLYTDIFEIRNQSKIVIRFKLNYDLFLATIFTFIKFYFLRKYQAEFYFLVSFGSLIELITFSESTF